MFDGLPVNIDKIPVGLELNCKVYFEKNGKFFFLCECDTVTPEIIDRFKKAVGFDNSVYIAANHLRAFYNKGIDLGWSPPEEVNEEPEQTPPPAPKQTTPPPSNDFERVKRQYEEVKTEAAELFAEIAKDHKINVEKTEDFIMDIRQKLESNDISLILQSINSIRNVDEYLHTHSLNVALLNGFMAKWLKYDKERHNQLVKVGLLHDIGKLKISGEILNKPARLTHEEFEEIKKHSHYSFEILVDSGIKEKNVLLGILQHHEKLNGTGYPQGIGADKITEYARITSISDIYDAMVAKRVYKDAQSPFAILENFSKEGYSELDINFVKIFIHCMVEELKGKHILLSDDSVATVVMVNERNLRFPMVEVDGRIITTSPELYCVSMYNHSASAEEVKKAFEEAL